MTKTKKPEAHLLIFYMMAVLGVTAMESKAIADTGISVSKTVTAINQFSESLYLAVTKEESVNTVISPLSAYGALSMAALGARAKTSAEFSALLHGKTDTASFHESVGNLFSQIAPQDAMYELRIANSLWGQKDYPWHPEFSKKLATQYHSEFQLVDFKLSKSAAKNAINSWTEKNTAHRIKDLISEGALNADTRFVIVNAIYLNAPWLYPFQSAMTTSDTFWRQGKTATKVSMMHQLVQVPYWKGAGMSAVSLPYQKTAQWGDKSLSMVLLLPDARDGLTKLEQFKRPVEILQQALSAPPQAIIVDLPKFHVETSVRLGSTLKTLGLKNAFDRKLADFSAMHTAKEPVWIDQVIQKAYIDVTEAGTEAAAATAVSSLGSGAAHAPVFRVDHPFLFAIMDQATGSVVFLGRVVEL